MELLGWILSQYNLCHQMRKRQTQREDSHVKIEAEIGVMLPERSSGNMGCEKLEETREDSSLKVLEETQSYQLLEFGLLESRTLREETYCF